jgi:pimeloyl-ACP methyl ester carboxylesterase
MIHILHRIFNIPYKLSVKDANNGGIPVIFLHGINSSSNNWKNVLPLLPTKYRPIAIDLLGFGDSPKPKWPNYNLTDHAKSVERTIKSLKMGQQVVVVGHSLGSLVAIELARRNPKMINRLILCSTPFYVQKEVNSEVNKYAKPNKKVNNALFAIYEKIIDNQETTLSSAQKIMKLAPKDSSFTLTPKTWVSFKKSLQNSIMSQNSYQTVQKLTIPILLLNGLTDVLLVNKHHRYLAKQYNNIKLEFLPSGHMINKLAGKQIAKAIINSKK